MSLNPKGREAMQGIGKAKKRLHDLLSDRVNRLQDGIIQVAEPLGTALLGASADEQVEVTVGGRARTAPVERIEKGTGYRAGGRVGSRGLAVRSASERKPIVSLRFPATTRVSAVG